MAMKNTWAKFGEVVQVMSWRFRFALWQSDHPSQESNPLPCVRAGSILPRSRIVRARELGNINATLKHGDSPPLLPIPTAYSIYLASVVRSHRTSACAGRCCMRYIDITYSFYKSHRLVVKVPGLHIASLQGSRSFSTSLEIPSRRLRKAIG